MNAKQRILQEKIARDNTSLSDYQAFLQQQEINRLQKLAQDLTTLKDLGFDFGVLISGDATSEIQQQVNDIVSSIDTFTSTFTQELDTKIDNEQLLAMLAEVAPKNVLDVSYTLQEEDNTVYTYLRMINESANQVIITDTQTKPIRIRQVGAGVTTLVADSGVVLNGNLVFVQDEVKEIVRIGQDGTDVLYDVISPINL